MTLKKRITNKHKEIEQIANELADKPYGEKMSQKDELVRTTITIPSSLLFTLEDIARNNKRKNGELKSVSAIVRYSIERYLN